MKKARVTAEEKRVRAVEFLMEQVRVFFNDTNSIISRFLYLDILIIPLISENAVQPERT